MTTEAEERLIRAAANLRDEARRFEWAPEVLEYADTTSNPANFRRQLQRSRERAFAYVDTCYRNVVQTIRDGDSESARLWYARARDAWANYVAQSQAMRADAREATTSALERGIQRLDPQDPNSLIPDLPDTRTIGLVIVGAAALYLLSKSRR